MALICQKVTFAFGEGKPTNDFVGQIAGESETRARAKDLHDAAKCLLGTLGHTVSLVENNDFVATRRQRYFGGSETLNALAHHVDSP